MPLAIFPITLVQGALSVSSRFCCFEIVSQYVVHSYLENDVLGKAGLELEILLP